MNMIISICHGVTAIIKAIVWDRVNPSIFKHAFLYIAEIDVSLFGSRGSYTVNVGYKDIGYNKTSDITTQDFGH